MNAMLIRSQQLNDPQVRGRYFDELERRGFGMACVEYEPLPYDQLAGSFRQTCFSFVEEAHSRNIETCIQIHCTLCPQDKVGAEEAQYDHTNKPVEADGGNTHASLASASWIAYLKDVIRILVQQSGFDHVVLVEPGYRVDIPGSKDRFHAAFTEANPEMPYPEARAETPEYLAVQKAKVDTVVSACGQLAGSARLVGARSVGIRPRGFLPRSGQDVPDTLNPASEVNRLIQIPDIDFLVTRMDHRAVFENEVAVGEKLQKSPRLCYMEIMGHFLGNRVMANAGSTAASLPPELIRDCMLCSVAAFPCGLGWEWDDTADPSVEKVLEAVGDAAAYTGRLGRPKADAAFVFSYSGARHAEPYTYKDIFAPYLAVANQMMFEEHLPMLTFQAETLEQNLADNPHVRVLVLDSHFPLSVDQMRAISKWWKTDGKHAIVAFGSGEGFVEDSQSPGLQPCGGSYPGVFQLIGLTQEDEPKFKTGSPINLRDITKVRRMAFLGNETELGLDEIANVRRIFGSRANVIYEADVEDLRIPVGTEWHDRMSLALFCGFGLSDQTASAAVNAIKYAVKFATHEDLMIDSCSDGVVWNMNVNDYVVLANLSDQPGTAVGRPGRAYFWDCRERKLLPPGDPQLEIPAKSFKVYRIVGRRSKFLDVLGTSCLIDLMEGAGRAEVQLVAGHNTTFVLLGSPKEIYVDGRPSTVSQEMVGDTYHVTLQQCPPGKHHVTLKW